MPEEAVRGVWASSARVEAGAERFAVSRLAAHWRLYGFDLVAGSPA